MLNSSKYRRSVLLAAVAVLLSILGVRQASAQASPTASGPGGYLQIGAGVSAFQADYGQRILGGGYGVVDANLTWRYGLEVEARLLRVHQDENVHETTYLAGPRVSLSAKELRPYVKLLVGRGEFNFPFNYATGSYFAVAPGAGVDWQPGGGRLVLRLIDFEYQRWPNFSFGPLQPYGISAGLAIQIFRGGEYPGAHRKMRK